MGSTATRPSQETEPRTESCAAANAATDRRAPGARGPRVLGNHENPSPPRFAISRPLAAFVAIVVATGAVAFAAVAPDGLGGRTGLALALVAGSLLSAAVPIRFPRLRFDANASHPFVFCALAVAGPFAAGAVDVAGVVGTAIGRRQRPRPVHFVFNLGLVAVCTAAAWQAWAATGGAAAPGLRGQLVAILAAGAAYYAVNVALLGVAVSLETGRPLVRLVRRSFTLTAAPFFTGVLLAGLMIPALELAVAAGLVLGIASAGLVVGMLRAIARSHPGSVRGDD